MLKKILFLTLALLCLTGCAAHTAESPLRAMYVPLDSGGYVMIDVTDENNVFTMEFPESIMDAEGNALTSGDFAAGNILEIYGAGDMAASWPGHLYGAQRIVLAEAGNPSDVERYRSLIDALTPPQPQACVNRAMYVPFGQDSYVMIEESGAVYTISFPEDMVDLNGQRITREELRAGNLLDIYGDGVMAESYPGQYFGVTRVEVVDEGDPADIEQYRSLIDGLYAEPEPLDEPPALHLEYAVSQAVAYTQASMGNFNWTVDNGDGTSSAVIACGAHVLQWRNLRQVNIAGAADIRVTCPALAPETLTCVRWPSSLYMTDDVTQPGQAVSLTANGDGSYTLPAEPDFLYCLYASWEQGSAEYGFSTAAQVVDERP